MVEAGRVSAPLYSGRCMPAPKSRSESVLRWSGKSAVFGLAAVALRIKA